LPHLYIYGTLGVALLANLGDFQNGVIADTQAGADWQGYQVDALAGDILGEVPMPHLQTETAHLVYAFHRQQADLAVSAAIRVGIVHQAVVLPYYALAYGSLPGVLFLTAANGDYFTGFSV